MNEVTKIHLGRQAFTISVDAHRELRGYLDAIGQYVSDTDVINEVELRMAELLTDRGITADQVILPADVSFLKEQLGNPRDFADDEQEAQEPAANKSPETKRLFRDTNSAMLAGVAAGLASYFDIDPIIVRLVFVIATFASGWGIVIYLVLWLLVPEAKTSSDRLQMAGRAVTIDSLKEVVERADVKGAAKRANRSLAGPISAAFNALFKLIGVCFMVVGFVLLLGLASGITYVLLRSGTLAQDTVFPVGFKEHLLIYVVAAVAAILSLFVVLLGLSTYRRKWPVHAWITSILVSLVLIGVATSGALAADVVPQVRNRYNANIHTTTHTVQPFTSLDLTSARVGDIEYRTSSTYSVSLRYYGNPNLTSIKTSVKNGVLTIDTTNFDPHRHCESICIPNDYGLAITVSSPTSPNVIDPNAPEPPLPPEMN